MIEVTVGSRDWRGVVYITFMQYLMELHHGGNKYFNVYCKHGIERFRVKYFREVTNAKMDKAGRLEKKGGKE